MIESYIPLFLLLTLALFLAAGFVLLSYFLGPKREDINKFGAYESGMDPISDAKKRYSVSFYIIAVEFIIFDLEILFLYPWAVRFQHFDGGTFWAMILFILILLIGLVYTLKKGTFDWDVKHTPIITNS